MYFIIARPGWVPGEASSPNLLGVCCISFKEKLGFQDHGGLTLIDFNEGLMKPRKGFTPVMGKKNWGLGKESVRALEKDLES